jgi:hypothetical protein
MCATAQTEQPGRATLLQQTVNLTSPPDCSARTLFAGPSALYPRGRGQWESRAPPRGSFIFNAEGKGRERQNPALTNRACSGGTRRVRGSRSQRLQGYSVAAVTTSIEDANSGDDAEGDASRAGKYTHIPRNQPEDKCHSPPAQLPPLLKKPPRY